MRTNALAALPVRRGLERYGGDCYLRAGDFRVAKIVRREYPAERTTWEPEPRDVAYSPGDPQWEYAKFCFRSTLFALVTLVATTGAGMIQRHFNVSFHERSAWHAFAVAPRH